jgi:hypothetical protein
MWRNADEMPSVETFVPIRLCELSGLYVSVVLCAYIASRRGRMQIAFSFVHRSLFAIIKKDT